MTKQEILDLETPTTQQLFIQRLLITQSKTSILTAQRVLKQLTGMLKTTKLKSLSIQEILDGLNDAANCETEGQTLTKFNGEQLTIETRKTK